MDARTEWLADLVRDYRDASLDAKADAQDEPSVDVVEED